MSPRAETEALRRDAILRDEPRNLAVLILYAVVFRVGWIFKTESVIMPAFLDSIAGAGWLRGMLPILNRIGQSVPPFLLAPALREPEDAGPHPPVQRGNALRDAARTLRDDRDFRRLVYVAGLFGISLLLFPHYQALARERLGLAGGSLLTWVVVQNLTVGAASLAVGPFADRRGNRLALRLVLFGAALVPALAIGLARLDPAAGRQSYWLVFVGIGLTPIAIRLLTNYTLEICTPAEHPRYLATLQLASSAPFLLAPLVGLLIDLTSFELVFLTTAGLTALSSLLTFGLGEPRHSPAP